MLIMHIFSCRMKIVVALVAEIVKMYPNLYGTYALWACDPLKYKMDKSMLILSISVYMGESIRMKRVNNLETLQFQVICQLLPSLA